MYALDVSSPLSPNLCGTLQGMDNRRQVVVQGKLAYVASREIGLRIWDFVNPEAPKLLREYKLSGRPDLAAIYNGKALIPAGHQGLLMERPQTPKLFALLINYFLLILQGLVSTDLR